MNLSSHVSAIGKKLVRCSLNCDGVSLDHENGILPRCLILEEDARETEGGCVVVGYNPGQSDDSERDFYIKYGLTYDAVRDGWSQGFGKQRGHGSNHPFYVRLRRLIDELGCKGPILWTELVKCECKRNVAHLPLQTLRTCVSNFLLDEMSQVPPDWPIFAVGRESHKAIAYLFPARPVIGVPHPTGSRGQFSQLFSGSAVETSVEQQYTKVLNTRPFGECWLEG